MRDEQEILELLLSTAREDELIRAHLVHVRSLPRDARTIY